ncbi:synapse-associated protein [Holotrichia oblita]|uniref:Synapse-associated protein n=1 Tax=Holotrichia oblita TaxID=644536 RepID=A0ACB9TIZ7_HOLOL|nr:synapse-associated protein [Holotrichia oblita]
MFSILKDQVTSWITSVIDDIDDASIPLNDLNTINKCCCGSEEDDVTKVEDQEINSDDKENILQTKVKSLGNLLYSTATELGTKILRTVEENPYFQEFNREQDAFVKNIEKAQASRVVLPWVGCSDEDAVREVCLSLSNDRRNFLRNPPDGIDFNFDYGSAYPVAVAIMEHDANLAKMRYEMVPKVISEENFWRNYFYRVSLVCEVNKDACTVGIDRKESPNEVEEFVSAQDINSPDKADLWDKEIEEELQIYEEDCDACIESECRSLEEEMGRS